MATVPGNNREARMAHKRRIPHLAEGPLCIRPSSDQHIHVRKLPKAGRGKIRRRTRMNS